MAKRAPAVGVAHGTPPVFSDNTGMLLLIQSPRATSESAKAERQQLSPPILGGEEVRYTLAESRR
jgi:hypothetical protein